MRSKEFNRYTQSIYLQLVIKIIFYFNLITLLLKFH
jgi:hypothetical protein